MPAENFAPDPRNEDVLEVKCAVCLREIHTESEYVEIFVEKFYTDMDEWMAMHRGCYESGIAVLIDTMDTKDVFP